MPCTKCNSDFNMFNWKLKCTECGENYCSNCLKKIEGHFYCDICCILIKQPPDKEKLMSLKIKDIRNYLIRNHISIHGLVEKHELVDLFFKNGRTNNIKRNGKKPAKNISGSVPNLSNAQAYINDLKCNAGAAFQNHTRSFGSFCQPRPNVNGNVRAGPSRCGTYPTQAPTTSNRASNHVNVEPSAPPRDNNVNPMESNTPIHTSQPPRYMKISDFKSLDDLNGLTPKELKELLALHRVDYKGCVEKSDLLEKANILWIDANMTNKEEDKEDADIDDCCKICMDAPLDCVLLECGHIATCTNCGKQLNECPICRQYVIRVVRTFKA